LLQLAEQAVRQHGRQVVVINSAIPALRFCLSNGYTEGEWHDLPSDMTNVVRVGKRLL